MTCNNYYQKWMRYALCSLIRLYQWSLAALFGGQCRFYPSCSNYALDVLHGHSLGRALLMIVKRVGRCHPFHPGGVDFPEVSGFRTQVSGSKTHTTGKKLLPEAYNLKPIT